MAKAEGNAYSGKETQEASPMARLYIPSIGRMVLNTQDFAPALTYLQERTNIFIQKLPFVKIIASEYLKGLRCTDGQLVLDTLPQHPNYESGRLNSDLECRVTRSRIAKDHTADMKISTFLACIKEKDHPDQLRDERVMLLEHMGASHVSDKVLSMGFRVPLAYIADYNYSTGMLARRFASLLPETMTLGPVQLEPQPTPGEAAQI